MNKYKQQSYQCQSESGLIPVFTGYGVSQIKTGIIIAADCMKSQTVSSMPVNVIRKNVIFQPDSSRVIARFLYNDDERSAELIEKILSMPERLQRETLIQILRDYSKRHRSISRVFEKNFNK